VPAFFVTKSILGTIDAYKRRKQHHPELLRVPQFALRIVPIASAIRDVDLVCLSLLASGFDLINQMHEYSDFLATFDSHSPFWDIQPMKNLVFFCCLGLAFGSQSLWAQTLQPLATFGETQPGWLAPGDYGSNNDTGGHTVRGIAYHEPSNRLIVVDRAAPAGPTVRILNGDTGEEVHILNEGENIVSGGFFLLNMVDCDDDGNVYVCNLSPFGQPDFAVYRWSSDAVENLTDEQPTVAFFGATGRFRTGDSFSVIGSGTSTRIVSSGGNENNGYLLMTTTDGLNFTATNPSVVGPPVGAFRFGIDFDGQGNVLGTQTATDLWRVAEAGGTAGQFNTENPSETFIQYHAPTGLLATGQYLGDPGINNVRLYDWSDFTANPVLLDTQNVATTTNVNTNANGAVTFGYGPDATLRVYALNANNGIQAFEVVMPSEAVIESAFVSHVGWGGAGSSIDSGKVLHREGTEPTTLAYENLINTARGINGVGFNISGLANADDLSAADFEFQVSPQGGFDEASNPPSGWAAAPAPSLVSVTSGTPDQVLIQWADNQIENRWLRITVKANANTGLAEDAVFYLGHLLGETTGPVSGIYTVAFADITPIRSQVGQTVDSSSIADIDKNGIVAFADVSAMRSNVAAQLTNITVP
jgi:hypothetical protein